MRSGLLALVVLGAALPARAAADEDAAAHFKAAEQAERRSDYEAAIVEYQQAYALRPHPSVLYNIAADYEALAQPIDAAEYYERYLDESTTPPDDAKDVERHADELRDQGGRALLDAALKARGGRRKLKKIAATAVTSHIDYQSGDDHRTGTIVLYAANERLRTVTSLDDSDHVSSTVVTADDAWRDTGDGKAHSLDDADAAEYRADLWRNVDGGLLLRHLEAKTQVRAEGREQVDGVTYDVVTISRADGAYATRIFLDDARLVRRLEYTSKDETATEEFDDWREVDGVLFSFTRRQSLGTATVTIAVDAVEVNPSLPKRLFDRPKK